MNDLISRKWLIECVEDGWIKFDTEKDTNRYIHLVRDIAPSAQPKWIPVSEGLPKKDGDYLVTTHIGQLARYIFAKGRSEEYWTRCTTAWMPLPEPYKEEK